MNCTSCGVVINPLRLKALPGTTVCVNCSDVSKYNVYVNTNVEREDVSQEIFIDRGNNK